MRHKTYILKNTTMIVFGIRSGKLKNEQILPDDCNYCKTEKSISFHYFQKYFHLFWIPVIPLGKTGAGVCSHCKQVLAPKEMNPEQLQKFMEIKKGIRTPLGYKIVLYVALCLIALPFIIGFTANFFR